MTVGYIALADQMLFRKLFAYMDTADTYRADPLFRKYQVKVRIKQEWQSLDGRYCLIFCSVPKKQAPLFEKAMEELPKRMKLLGYDDYADRWHRTVRPALDGDSIS